MNKKIINKKTNKINQQNKKIKTKNNKLIK